MTNNLTGLYDLLNIPNVTIDIHSPPNPDIDYIDSDMED